MNINDFTKNQHKIEDLNKDNGKNILKNFELKKYKKAWDFFQNLNPEIKNNKNLFPEIENKTNHLQEYERYKLFQIMIFSWEKKRIIKNNWNHFDYLEALWNKIKYQLMFQILKKKEKYFAICDEIKNELDIINQNVKKIHRMFENKEGYTDKIKWTNFLIEVCEATISILGSKQKPQSLEMKKCLTSSKTNLNTLVSTMNYLLSFKNLEFKKKLIINYQKLATTNENLVEKTEKLAELSKNSTEITKEISKHNQKQTKFYKWTAIASVIAISFSCIATTISVILKFIKY